MPDDLARLLSSSDLVDAQDALDWTRSQNAALMRELSLPTVGDNLGAQSLSASLSLSPCQVCSWMLTMRWRTLGRYWFVKPIADPHLMNRLGSREFQPRSRVPSGLIPMNEEFVRIISNTISAFLYYSRARDCYATRADLYACLPACLHLRVLCGRGAAVGAVTCSGGW